MALPRFPLLHHAGRFLASTVVALAAAALAACATLPPPAPRTASFADDDVADTTLARIVAASTPADAAGLSGFRLLADGGQAWEARLALIDRKRSGKSPFRAVPAEMQSGYAARAMEEAVLADEVTAGRQL